MTTRAGAARYLAQHGFALLFPAPRTVAPCLWEAVAGADAEPFATGMNENESRVWAWKDELPREGEAWSGKFLYRRASLLSPPMLALLYPGAWEPDDHRTLDLSREAREIAEALVGGALPTSALRQIIGDKARYERAIGELHRNLLISSAGTAEQRTGWPAVLIDLTCRLFPVGGGPALSEATRRYLDTTCSATPRELARAFGWSVTAARTELDALVAIGAATRSADAQYRPAATHTPRPTPSSMNFPASARSAPASPAAASRAGAVASEEISSCLAACRGT